MSTIKVGGYRRYARFTQNGVQMEVLRQSDVWWSPERIETHPEFIGWKDPDWQHDEVEMREEQS